MLNFEVSTADNPIDDNNFNKKTFLNCMTIVIIYIQDPLDEVIFDVSVILPVQVVKGANVALMKVSSCKLRWRR